MASFKIDKYFWDDSNIEEDEAILQPFAHIAEITGKNVRAKFCKAMNRWLNIPKEKLDEVQHMIETLHTASLLLDDIQDKSALRRGIPTAHRIYGTLRTCNSVAYVGSLIGDKVLKLESNRAVELFAKATTLMYMGQGMEIYWRDNFTCPTLEEYKLMCIRKTGAVFSFAIEIMQLFSDVEHDFTKFSDALGLFFQIRDDYMNLCSEEYTAKKTFCEDISEGKFSFPIIHAIETQPGDRRVINILKQKTDDIEKKKYCLQLLKKFGSLNYTKQVLIKLQGGLLEEIASLPPNPLILHLINNILNFTKNGFMQVK